jgi:hypothetical protein
MGQVKGRFHGMEKVAYEADGAGWCPIKETIVMDDDWWKKARVVSVDM